MAPGDTTVGSTPSSLAMESFFATLKTECFQNPIPKNRAQARAMLFDYIETFYNPKHPKRLHSALGYLSPLEFEKLLNHRPNPTKLNNQLSAFSKTDQIRYLKVLAITPPLKNK